MKNIIKHMAIFLIFAGYYSCDILEPVDENKLSTEYISTDPQSAEGILLQGYTGLINQYSFSEAGTDDAVNNQLSNGFKHMAYGELSAQFNPGSRWDKYEQVLYMNKFIDVVEQGNVQWNRDKEINDLFKQRLKGEAIALRAIYHFYVLQAHAGIGASGNLLGIPYIKEFTPSGGDFNLPRLSFKASVEAIMADFDAALELLPMDYSDIQADILPRYAGIDFVKYKVANGAQNNLRISGRIVKALKARLALLAASPSFLNGDGFYEIAANISSEVLNTKGGISGLAADGVVFYDTDLDMNNGESIWRSSLAGTASTQEENNFPPSVNGKGQINPTHNFVLAFPMKNGFPATAANGYDPQTPYENRDPRLLKFVVVNGSSIGGGIIKTGVAGGVNRVDSISEQSTTTGYYLRKLLREDVRLNNDGTKVPKKHYNVFFRYTELFLILAESANEIGGPIYKVNGISAFDVIAAIRKRAGITQPDNYLATITTKEAMREVIRNERRLELSFEGHRFWDLRRWGMSLTEPATGYFYNGTGYVELPAVEARNYPSHAKYLPIPYTEMLKFSELEQNQGW